jgi:ribosome biogenesis protein Nip4
MRPLTDEEQERLRTMLSGFADDLPRRWSSEEQAELWTDEASPARVFLVRSALAEALRSAGPGPSPAVIGLYLGDMRRESFVPGLEGAYEIGRRSRTARVTLKPKGAQLFLYGRDVLGESIATADRAAGPGSTVIVANAAGEALGLAKVLGPLPGRGRVLEPIVDRGWYLREGG